MALSITSLNSGSNGNCYYVGNQNEAILVDAGISCRETEKRMKRLGLSLAKVKAIFVSHEHSDHIRGLAGIAKKYHLPVYITPTTLKKTRLREERLHYISFQPYEPVRVGELLITPFPKFHDAVDPHSFVVAYKDTKVGVFTDIGAPCDHVVQQFQQCHAVFLEANYDDDLLDQGYYPIYLKNRIRGGHGHLSNRQAFELFTTHKPAFMSHLLLSHLSKHNNCPDLVKELFTSQAAGTEIIVASRYEETPIYTINSTQTAPMAAPLQYSFLEQL
jgi:phosphoribosyl 1,2-cyclic phosphodiesterase